MKEPVEGERQHRRNFGRRERGLWTPTDAFYAPILQALEELRGSGSVGEVLAAVERHLKSSLKDVDYESLASDPNLVRWLSMAQWARYAIVKERLLSADSPRGIWEIADEGRRRLEHLERDR